jgi:hypothetical protein
VNFDKILENCYASCSLGLAKDISDCFFVAFLYFFWLLCLKIWKMALLRGEHFFLEISLIRYLFKNREFCADFKN